MDNYNNYGGGFSFTPNDYNSQLMQAQRKEKNGLFKNASFLGVLLLLYNLFNSLYLNLFYILSYTYYHGGFSVNLNEVKLYLANEQTEAVTSSAYSMTANVFIIVLSALSLLIVAECFMKIHFVSTMLKPYKGCVKQGIKWTPLCLTFNLLASIVVALITQMMNQSGIEVPEADFSITEPSQYAIIIQLVYVCIIGPVVEEIIYRGLVIKLLSPYGKGMAIFFSALFFGLMHGNLSQSLTTFIGGIIYAMVAVNCNSIVPTLIIHVLNNTFASITDIGDALGLDNAYTLYLALVIILMFMGFYSIIVMLKGLYNDIKKSEPAFATKSSTRYVSVFTNIFVLVYILYLLWDFIESFLYYNS